MRARLFSGFERRLFDRKAMEKRHPGWIEQATQHWALAGLAFAMQRLGTGTEVKHDWAMDILPAQVDIPTRTRSPRRRPPCCAWPMPPPCSA